MSFETFFGLECVCFWRKTYRILLMGHYLNFGGVLDFDRCTDVSGFSVVTMGEEIFLSLYYVSLAALYAGESLHRWKHVQSSMLEKDPGKPNINRLRVIHLFEVDCNLLLKILKYQLNLFNHIYHKNRKKRIINT